MVFSPPVIVSVRAPRNEQNGERAYALGAVNEDALNVCCRRRAGMEAWSRLPFYFHNNRPLTEPCP